MTRTSNEVKEMWTYLHGLYNKLDEMKDEARRVKGVYSQVRVFDTTSDLHKSYSTKKFMTMLQKFWDSLDKL